MISTRKVHRSDGVVVGQIHKVTGADRAAFSYEPIEELPAVIYGGECTLSGDASWWDTFGDARADIIRWSYVVCPHGAGALAERLAAR